MSKSEEYEIAKRLINAFCVNLKQSTLRYSTRKKFIVEIDNLTYSLTGQDFKNKNFIFPKSSLVAIPQKDFNASGLKHISKKMLTNLSWTQIYRGFDPDPYLRGMFVSRLLGLDGYYFHDRLAIGTMLLLPGVMYPFHTHDVNELYYCISGKLEIRHTVSGVPFFLKSGDLSITPKAQLHSLSVLGNKPVLLFYSWRGNLRAPIWLWEKRNENNWERVLWKREPGDSWLAYRKQLVSEDDYVKANRENI